ncbi:hypothetical protein AMTRI_Chr08g166900 [Amborella trichopoda]
MAASAALLDEANPLASYYGDIPLKELQSKEISGQAWTEVNQRGGSLCNVFSLLLQGLSLNRWVKFGSNDGWVL